MRVSPRGTKVMKGVNLKAENVEYVRQLAHKEGRSFSNMLDRIIERYRAGLDKLKGEG